MCLCVCLCVCVCAKFRSLADDSTRPAAGGGRPLRPARKRAPTDCYLHVIRSLSTRPLVRARGTSHRWGSSLVGPHGRKINTCAKGGIGCRRSRSRRQWKHAERRADGEEERRRRLGQQTRQRRELQPSRMTEQTTTTTRRRLDVCRQSSSLLMGNFNEIG